MSAQPRIARGRTSLLQRLLVGVLVPVLVLLAVNSALLYRQALRAADTAYDRTLLATAKSLGDQLELVPLQDGRQVVRATLPYAALDAFEADNRSRLYYRIGGLEGEHVMGHQEVTPWRGPLPERANHGYAALVHFLDTTINGTPVRMAVFLQPMSSSLGYGMATVQVAETLELREALARQLLLDTASREALLMAVVAAIVVLVVHRATQPLRRLTNDLQARDEADLTPLTIDAGPREVHVLGDATNALMARLQRLLDHQKRFVRDASHQLRTPLAVLKAQVQSAQRGDIDAHTALRDIAQTTDRATTVANQMLALAKVEQLRGQGGTTDIAWAQVVRDVALDLGPLIAQKNLDFDIQLADATVQGHEWSMREMARNLLHNAVKHTPPGGRLRVQMRSDSRHAALSIEDSGPGLSPAVKERLFQPFVQGTPEATGAAREGSGLGLAICQAIVEPMGGTIALESREHGGRVVGLTATVSLPLSAAKPPADAPATSTP